MKARQARDVTSSAPCQQGKRPRRLAPELDPPAAQLDRMELARNRSGLEAYYAKLAASSLAVRKAGARWFVDVRSTVASPLPCWQQLTVCAGRRASLVACPPRLGGGAAYRADARPV